MADENKLRIARNQRNLRKSEVAAKVTEEYSQTTGLKIDRAAYGRIEERIDALLAGEPRQGPADPTTLDKADALAKFFGNAVTRDQILFPRDYSLSAPSEAA